VAGALLTCCSRGSDETPRVRVTVISIEKDTVRFALPARARYCDDRRSVLLESVSPWGNGILVRLRYGDSLASGTYAVISPGDTTTRGASVGLRYMVRDVAHSVTEDSGSVEVRRGTRQFDALAKGWGLDRTVRVPITAEYTGVPLRADTVPCRYEP